MQDWTVRLAEYSAVMGLIAFVYLLAGPLLRRVTERTRYLVWIIIVIGFIVPFRPSINSAPVRVAGERLGAAVQTAILTLENKHILPADSTRTEQEKASIQQAMVAQESAATTQASRNTQELLSNFELTDMLTTPEVKQSIQDTQPSVAKQIGFSMNLWTLLFTVWLTGAVGSLGYHLFCNYRFGCMLRRWARPLEDKRSRKLLYKLCKQMGIRRTIALRQCPPELLNTPMLKGLWHPLILLPALRMEEEERKLILKHELTHYQRGDLIVKLLSLLMLSLHWFNPLAYVAYRALSAQCEQACDEAVLAGVRPHKRKAYGHTLLGYLSHTNKHTYALTTSFSGSKRSLKRRLTGIMNLQAKKKGYLVCIVFLMFTLLAGTLSMTGCEKKTAGKTAAPTKKYTQQATTISTKAPVKEIQPIDLNGRTVKIFTECMSTPERTYSDVESSYVNSDAITKQYEVEKLLKIQKNYNCKFKFTSSGGQEFANSLMAGTSDCDFVINNDISIQWSVSLDCFLPLDQYADILEVNNSNLWNVKKQNFLKFGQKQYFVCPDNAYQNIFGNEVLFFNKSIMERAGIWEKYNLYSLQKNKKWNWQTFQTICEKVTVDTDKDGVKDQYGFMVNEAALRSFVLSNGNGGDTGSLVTPGSDGALKLDLKNASKRKAIDFLHSLTQRKCAIPAQSPGTTYFISSGNEPANLKTFMGGDLLFYMEKGSFMTYLYENHNGLVDFLDDWGIITVPAGPDNTQNNYYISNNHAPCIGIVKFAKDPEKLVKLLRVFGPYSLSSNDMIKAWYDTIVNSKLLDPDMAQTYQYLSSQQAMVNSYESYFLMEMYGFYTNFVDALNDKIPYDELFKKDTADIQSRINASWQTMINKLKSNIYS